MSIISKNKDCFFVVYYKGAKYSFQNDSEGIRNLKIFIKNNDYINWSKEHAEQIAKDKEIDEALILLNNLKAEEKKEKNQYWDAISDMLTTSQKLSNRQIDQLASYLSYIMLKNKVSLADAKILFDKYIKETFEETEIKVSEVVGKYAEDSRIQRIVSLFEDFKEQYEAINENYNLIQESAVKKLKALEVDIEKNLEDDRFADDDVFTEDYSKSDIEILPQERLGIKVKKAFAAIESEDTGFMGVPLTYDYNQTFASLLSFVGRYTEAPTTVDDFVDMLKENQASKMGAKIYQKVLELIKNNETDIIKAMITATHLEAVRASFASISENSLGTTLQYWETNANSQKNKTKSKWKDRFSRTALVDESGEIVSDEVDNLIETYEELSKIKDKTTLDFKKKVVEFFDKFGIEISLETLEYLENNPMQFYYSGRFLHVGLDNLFNFNIKIRENYEENIGINIYKWLSDTKQKLKKGKKVNIYNDDGLLVQPGINKSIDALAELQNRIMPENISLVRYSNKKLVSDYERQNIFYQKINELKSEDSGYRNRLRTKVFSQDNPLLLLLENNDEFRDIFEHRLTDISAIKLDKTDFPMFPDIDQIDDIDYMMYLKTAFQFGKYPSIANFVDGKNNPMRIASLPTPTNSDKGRMFMMQTAAYAISHNTEHYFTFSKTGEMRFSKDLRDIIFNSLVLPELKRIIHTNTNTNLNMSKEYLFAARRFNFIPRLNDLQIGGKTFNEIANSLKDDVDLPLEVFNAVADYLEDHLSTLADKKLEKYRERKLDKNDNLFKKQTDFFEHRAENMHNKEVFDFIIELDQEINSQINYVNFYQLIAADIAQFSNVSKQGNMTETEISKKIAINAGKRFGSITASGEVNTTFTPDETYYEVILQDIERPAITLKNIISYIYGENNSVNKIAKKVFTEAFLPIEYAEMTVGEILDLVVDGTINSETYPDFLNHIENTYILAKDFFNINSTDGQEYITVEEGLRVDLQAGRIIQETYNDIISKVEGQREDLAKGNKIQDKNRLTFSEKALIMQPEKPVFAGNAVDDATGINKYVYVKSSAFKLIPEMTVGLPIDNLRLALEKLQSKGKNVRAAFESAVKVGVPPTKLVNLSSPTLVDDLFALNPNVEGSPILELPRKYFKIQQGIPDKTGQGQKEISMGTQIFKLLFGNDTVNYTFEYKGKEISGAELRDEFFNVFTSLVDIDIQRLVTRLGLDENYNSVDENKKIETIQRILVEEMEKRGDSQTDIDRLNINIKSNGESEFNIPLPFISNNYKLQSLLLSIVQNRVLKRKIPGYSFVAVSEEGFNLDKYGDIEDNSIIFLDGKRRETLGVTDDGYFEVLLPSKFFDNNGNLLDLFQKDDEGNYIYIEQEEGGPFTLKTEMFDKELLDQFSFRIPTSSQSLANKVRVVGITPRSAGDVIMMPNTYLSLTGSDFDIDKFNNYIYNHYIDKDGTVKKVTRDSKDHIKLYAEELRELRQNTINDIYGNFRELISPYYQEFFELIKQTGDIAEVIKGTDKNGKINYITLIEIVEDAILHDIITEEEFKDFNAEVAKKLYLLPNQIEAKKIADIISQLIDKFRQDKDDVYAKYKPLFKEYYGKLIRRATEAKILENEFIDIHFAVYNNEEVNKNLSKSLSIAYTTSMKDKIEAITEVDDVDFNILSTDYQQERIIRGSSGKAAVGIYAKGVTFFSTANQVRGKKPSMKIVNRLGKLTVDGNFGNSKIAMTEGVSEDTYKSLGLSVQTGDYLDERVQISVDNEKAQVLGSVGLTTNENLAVDNLLLQLGVAASVENGQVYDIPFLLHSQPVIKAFIAELSKGKSVFSENFVSPLEAFNKVVEKYFPQYKNTKDKSGKGRHTLETLHELYKKDYPNLTGVNLTKALTEDFSPVTTFNIDTKEPVAVGTQAGRFAFEVLTLYMNLIEHSKKLKTFTSISDASRVGKSFAELYAINHTFNSIEKEEGFGIKNYESIFGEFVDDYDSISKEDRKIAVQTSKGRYFIPRTNQGFMIAHAIAMSNKVYSTLDILQNKDVRAELDYILDANPEASLTAKAKIVEAYTTALKDYAVSSSNNHTVKFKGDIQDIKESILFGKDAISDMVIEVLKHPDTPYWVKENAFLSNLSFSKDEDTGFDSIQYNTISDNIDSAIIVEAIRDLLIDNTPLPVTYRNGQVTIRDLMLYLIDYDLLVGGTNRNFGGWYQFLPQDFLDKYVTNNGNTYSTEFRNLFETINSGIFDFDGFLLQFYRHNPTATERVSKARMKKVRIGPEILYEVNHTERPEYLHTTIKGKTYLLERDNFTETGAMYKVIPTLGSTRITEYNMNSDGYHYSIVRESEKRIQQQKIQEQRQVAKEKKKQKSQSTITKASDSIKRYMTSRNKRISALANIFNKFDLSEYVIIEDDSLPANVLGKYNPETKTILVNLKAIEKEESISARDIVLAELAHAIIIDSGLELDYDAKSDKLVNPESKYKTLFNIYEQYRDSKIQTAGTKHSVKNFHEFLSRVFSGHIETLEQLNTLEYVNPITKEKKTLLQRIVEAISKFIQDFANINGINLKEGSLLEGTLAELFSVLQDRTVRHDTKEMKTPATNSRQKALINKIYNETTTRNSRIKLKPWKEILDVDSPFTEDGIVTTRTKAEYDFGNPFSTRKERAKPDYSPEKAVKRYIEWILYSDEPKAQWIKKQLTSGALIGKQLIYYSENKQQTPTHADALQHLIDEYAKAIEERKQQSTNQTQPTSNIQQQDSITEQTKTVEDEIKEIEEQTKDIPKNYGNTNIPEGGSGFGHYEGMADKLFGKKVSKDSSDTQGITNKERSKTLRQSLNKIGPDTNIENILC